MLLRSSHLLAFPEAHAALPRCAKQKKSQDRVKPVAFVADVSSEQTTLRTDRKNTLSSLSVARSLCLEA